MIEQFYQKNLEQLFVAVKKLIRMTKVNAQKNQLVFGLKFSSFCTNGKGISGVIIWISVRKWTSFEIDRFVLPNLKLVDLGNNYFRTYEYQIKPNSKFNNFWFKFWCSFLSYFFCLNIGTNRFIDPTYRSFDLKKIWEKI